MRLFTASHQHYCGVDLHARSMYARILYHERAVRLHRNMPAEPYAFLDAIEPFRADLVVGAECILTWYWLVDLCAEQDSPLILGHALYMTAIHGGKAKNDRINSRERADLLSHIQNTNSQYDLEPFGATITHRSNRQAVAEQFLDPDVRLSVEAHLDLTDPLRDRRPRALPAGAGLRLLRQAGQVRQGVGRQAPRHRRQQDRHRPPGVGPLRSGRPVPARQPPKA